MTRPKKNPHYNPEQIMNELLETVSEMYNSHLSIRKMSDELDLDWQKVRKLLCTASYRGIVAYDSVTADEVIDYYKQGKPVIEIISLTGLSRSSVMSYLPYTKVPYNTAEVSSNAERIRVFRIRDQAVKELEESPERLWQTIKLFQGYPFKTDDGRKFKYEINVDLMLVDHKKFLFTKNTVEITYRKFLEMNGHITGTEEIGILEERYLYPIFIRLSTVKTDDGDVPKQEKGCLP